MLKQYCGDVTIWTYPPPYVTISHHFRVPPPSLPRWRPSWTTPTSQRELYRTKKKAKKHKLWRLSAIAIFISTYWNQYLAEVLIIHR